MCVCVWPTDTSVMACWVWQVNHGCRVLHYTGHGLESSCLAFEVHVSAGTWCDGSCINDGVMMCVQDAKGAMHAIDPHNLRNLIAAGGSTDIQVRALFRFVHPNHTLTRGTCVPPAVPIRSFSAGGRQRMLLRERWRSLRPCQCAPRGCLSVGFCGA